MNLVVYRSGCPTKWPTVITTDSQTLFCGLYFIIVRYFGLLRPCPTSYDQKRTDPAEIVFDEAAWISYLEANKLFAEAIQKEVKPGDLVWVQDYHLMLLPKMLRRLLDGKSPQLGQAEEFGTPLMGGGKSILRRNKPRATSESSSNGGRTRSRSRLSFSANNDERFSPETLLPSPIEENYPTLTGDKKKLSDQITIGFFLHTPFPSSEIYRILPVRKEILLGILHCDLIGFHTYDYARHFLSSCTRILNLPTMPNGT